MEYEIGEVLNVKIRRFAGAYDPPGTLIARWYCPPGQQTFSLLPDCFAARLSGTLEAVEAAVEHLEQVGTQEAAVASLRTDI